jgi:squalene-hopene/tetraprenyl-beta-curcumene cyclase
MRCILLLPIVLLAACSRYAASWDAQAAAAYLDQRETWWSGWHASARDHGSFCISCHTALPYALARPVLREGGKQSAAAPPERQLLENVSRRVRLWSALKPYYADKAAASRGTEAVLNALILSSYDAHRGRLSEDTKAALGEMWVLQETSGENAGAWPWIQFNNEPWEAPDSAFYGAALAALATGIAPEGYSARPDIQAGLERLRGYLERSYASQSLANRVVLLWVAPNVPGVLDRGRQELLIDQLWRDQRPDGGWSLASLIGSWSRGDGTAQVLRSDGYATGLVTLALEQTGPSATDPRLIRARAWLASHQDAWNGRWDGYSLNAHRVRFVDSAARFMDDAATAFAVLALSKTSAKH